LFYLHIFNVYKFNKEDQSIIKNKSNDININLIKKQIIKNKLNDIDINIRYLYN